MSILGLSITDTTPLPIGAGFWIRALARLVDLIYFQVVSFGAGLVGGICLVILQALSVTDAGWVERLSGGSITLGIGGIIGSVFYHTLCEGVHGATIGKLVCGVRVLSQDLTSCSLKSALQRTLAYFVDGLVFGAVGYLEMKKTVMEQRHGDTWAHTIVVKKSHVPEASKRPVSRLLLALALGTAAYASIMVLALIGVGI